MPIASSPRSACLIVAAATLCATASGQFSCPDPEWLVGDGIPGADGYVQATTNWDPDGSGPVASKLVIGGWFTSAGNISTARVIAYDPATSEWSEFGSGMSGGNVYAVATFPNGHIVAGGNFVVAGGVTANRISQWDGSTWAPLGPGVDGGSIGPFVFSLAVLPNGDLIAGGSFSTAGGLIAPNIARWNGLTWLPLESGTNGIVYSLTVMPNGDVVAGGAFTAAGNVSASLVARWNGSAWSPFGAGLTGIVTPYVAALAALPNGDLIAGGDFSTAGGNSVNRIARWDGSGWFPLGSGVSSDVASIVTTPAGDLIVGGTFATAGGVAVNRVAKWNGSAWSSLGTGITGGPFPYVESLSLAANGDLFAGGPFTAAGGHAAKGVARWNGSDWSPLGLGINNSVHVLLPTTSRPLRNQLTAGA